MCVIAKQWSIDFSRWNKTKQLYLNFIYINYIYSPLPSKLTLSTELEQIQEKKTCIILHI